MVDAEQAAGHRDEQQRTPGDAGGTAGPEGGDDAEQQCRTKVDRDAEGVDGGQGQYGDGDGSPGHVDGGPQRDRHRVGVFVKAQFLAQGHVDRNVGGRRPGEEGGDAAFAQAGEDQRIGVAAGLAEDDQRVDDQGDEQHGAQQHGQQVHVAGDGLEAAFTDDGADDQAEDAVGRKADDEADDGGHGFGSVGDQAAGGVGSMAEGRPEQCAPGDQADVVGLGQCLDRVGHHAHQQVVQDFTDAGGRCLADRFDAGEMQGGRKQP